MDRESAKKSVLIVDDDLPSLNVLVSSLLWEGYRVLTAQSGTAALDILNLEKPGLVLLDIMMPDMDGMETLERIKALEPEIPVAMVTGISDPEEAKRALEAGAYEYITKPIDINYLKLAVLLKLLPDE